jgi:hypothetical protein
MFRLVSDRLLDSELDMYFKTRKLYFEEQHIVCQSPPCFVIGFICHDHQVSTGLRFSEPYCHMAALRLVFRYLSPVNIPASPTLAIRVSLLTITTNPLSLSTKPPSLQSGLSVAREIAFSCLLTLELSHGHQLEVPHIKRCD